MRDFLNTNNHSIVRFIKNAKDTKQDFEDMLRENEHVASEYHFYNT